MTDPDAIFVQYLIALREQLKACETTKEDVLWSLMQSRITIDSAIEGLIVDNDTPDTRVPDGWPPEDET